MKTEKKKKQKIKGVCSGQMTWISKHPCNELMDEDPFSILHEGETMFAFDESGMIVRISTLIAVDRRGILHRVGFDNLTNKQ
jgi:hypothetical protein